MRLRAPIVAGAFYPAQPAQLRREIASFCGVRPTEERVPAKGVLVPHAGYIYSGAVAARVFSLTEPASLYLILGPNHTGLGTRASLWPEGAWRTPLGEVPVDAGAAQALLKESAILCADERAHLREHSLEVQLPLLQEVVGRPFSIVPVTLAHLSLKECAQLGRELASFIQSWGERAVIVASSDMSHYVSDAYARKVDRLAIDRMLALDPEGLYQTVEEHEITMCGFIPATATLTAAIALGATQSRLVGYTTSAEASGDYERVVGYAGMQFW